MGMLSTDALEVRPGVCQTNTAHDNENGTHDKDAKCCVAHI